MTDIDKAREIVKEQLAKGTPADKIKEVMWDAGYTQSEITAAMSDVPAPQMFVAAAPKPAAQSTSKGVTIAVAALVVIVFTTLPFLMLRPGVAGPGGQVSGNLMSIDDVKAYDTLIKQKIKQEGGMVCDTLITLGSGSSTVTATGKVYFSGDDKSRSELTMSASGLYGDETVELVSIEDGSKTYTRNEPDYLNPAPYWTVEEESMLDTSESLPDIDYYDQGTVACGNDQCKKIYANYEGVKITILARDDGFTPLIDMQSPLESMRVEMSNPVFGPQDPSLFVVPDGEEIKESSYDDLFGYY